jgi:hypothetical protein
LSGLPLDGAFHSKLYVLEGWPCAWDFWIYP